ncbi:MAG: dTDP-glucose 4,6-dehydratase [bacterium]|nr:dTDP-glucose 4,6-dehydratase [bacterium]
MNILVTGGCGFMGSHFIRHILATYPQYSIVNLDALTYCGNPENLKDIQGHPQYLFVKGDITDGSLVNALVSDGIDVIVNYAAETHVDRSILDPKAFITTDVLGTHTLLEAAKRYGVHKYIQISTDEVFGTISSGSFTEHSPFQPNSPYAASKAGGDLLARAYFKTYGVPVIGTHASNCFGPNQYPEKFIPLFITNLLEEKKVPLYGDGQQVREWLYVTDHARAIDHVLHHGGIGERYVIGSGEERSNKEVVDILLSTLDKSEDMVQYVVDRPGHDRRYSVDSSKLRTLGWMPEYTFAEGMGKTIQWYQEHQEWWRPLKSGEFRDYYQKQYVK